MGYPVFGLPTRPYGPASKFSPMGTRIRFHRMGTLIGFDTPFYFESPLLAEPNRQPTTVARDPASLKRAAG
jgi:hypothetical protein